MRIRRFRMLAGVVLLALASSLALGSAGVGGGRALGAATTLTILAGDVTVRHGLGVFTPARDGEVIAAGDAVRTSADARAVITYFEGSTVTIEPETLLIVDTAEATSAGTIVEMTQVIGRTWHVVTKLAGSGSRYEVRTPSSTASVRGTEFVVRSDAESTTVTTTEGMVVAAVPDPAQGSTVEVPVAAGEMQTQRRDAPPAPAQPAPAPERTVSVRVGSQSGLVVDPLGRTNGVTKDGKLVAQTPGARVKRDGGDVVVELPDMPDGRLAARVDRSRDDGARSKDRKDDVDAATTTVKTSIRDRGGRVVELKDQLRGADAVAGFDVRRGDGAKSRGRVLDESERKALPSGKITKSDHKVPDGAASAQRGAADQRGRGDD